MVRKEDARIEAGVKCILDCDSTNLSDLVREAAPVKHSRSCVECGERLAPDVPGYWTRCRRCYAYASFRRAVEAFRRTQP